MGRFFARLKVVAAMIGLAAITGLTSVSAHAADGGDWVFTPHVHAAPGQYSYFSGSGVSTSIGFVWGLISAPKVATIGSIGAVTVDGVGLGGNGSARYKFTYGLYYTPTWVPDQINGTSYATRGYTATYLFMTTKSATTSSKNGNSASTYAGTDEGFYEYGNTDSRMFSNSPATAGADATINVSSSQGSLVDTFDGYVLRTTDSKYSEIWSYVTTNLAGEGHDTRALGKLSTETIVVTQAAADRWIRQRNGSLQLKFGDDMWMTECVAISGGGNGLGSASTSTIETVTVN